METQIPTQEQLQRISQKLEELKLPYQISSNFSKTEFTLVVEKDEKKLYMYIRREFLTPIHKNEKEYQTFLKLKPLYVSIWSQIKGCLS